jgi:hypothetical protein
VQQRHSPLVQPDVLLLGLVVVALDCIVVVIVSVAPLARDRGLERRDSGRHLLARDDTLGRRRLADDVEQLPRVRLQHHEGRAGAGFESVQHGCLAYL